MTTIACNREMMAGDTMYCDGNLKGKVKTKIYKVKGDIIGYAGSVAEGEAFIQWYRDPEIEKPDISDTSILVLKHDGIILLYDGCYHATTVTDRDCYAIGTGRDFAISAMALGYSPYTACQVAADHDVYTSKPIRKLTL